MAQNNIQKIREERERRGITPGYQGIYEVRVDGIDGRFQGSSALQYWSHEHPENISQLGVKIYVDDEIDEVVNRFGPGATARGVKPLEISQIDEGDVELMKALIYKRFGVRPGDPVYVDEEVDVDAPLPQSGTGNRFDWLETGD